jgi:hypothetical protein
MVLKQSHSWLLCHRDAKGSPIGAPGQRKKSRRKTKIIVAVPPNRGNMDSVWRSRACSLTFCRPRGGDFPEPATGIRRRDVGRAGRIAPARFGAKTALCASPPTFCRRHREVHFTHFG